MKRIPIVTFSLCLSVLHGCATLNESECSEANWQDIGFKDGSAGERSLHITSYQKACDKHDIAVDVDNYNTGRSKGLITFCTADKGYKTGLYGNEYFDVCSKPLASEFKAAYVKGLRIKLDQLSMEQRGLDRYITDNRFELATSSTSGLNTSQQYNMDHLQSRMQSLAHVRLVIQGWIVKWSTP